MIQKSRVWSEFEALPPAAQRQVADLIAALRTRAGEESTAGAAPLREEPFIGLWANREELSDSAAWVRRLRQSEWQGR